MIANERQYRITNAAAREFEEALARLETVEAHRPPEMRRVMREAMESQLDELREEMPDALIRARIAVGLTQKKLAERLGLKEQQVQRYEATQYAGVSLDRIQAVAEALGVEIHERVILPAASGS